jgi:prepilin-type N-terminal cleavage/methylation domain-containing protein
MGRTNENRGLRRRDVGFTLVELIIVIAIILILASMLVVAIVKVTTDAQYAKTEAIVKLLDDGCRVYKVDFGVFPPNDKGDSRALHHYLGSERVVLLDAAAGMKTTKKPIILFNTQQLKQTAGPPDAKNPVPPVDAWDEPIRYANPGRQVKNGVDIWSAGKNGRDELDPANKDFDDVCNWIKN